MINKIKNSKYYKTWLFFVIEGIYLIAIDFFNQYLVMNSFSLSLYIIKTAVLFNVFWVIVIFIILYMLNPKPRKVVTCILNIFLLFVSIINYFLRSYFSITVSWKDIFLSGEGVSFFSSIFKYISLEFILFILVCVFFIVCMLKIKTRKIYKFKSFQSLMIVGMIFLLILGYNNVKKELSSVSDGWNSNDVLNNHANYYTNWLDTSSAIRVSGTYEYIIRDFYFSFLKEDSVISAKNEAMSYIKNYVNKGQKEKNYTGIFKGKNLIFVMMESMDDWLVNEDVTPTMYYMMNHGFNFINHYSPPYVTGSTANTEFVANTGLYPYLNKLSPNYAYVDNNYPFSIANLFKQEGYIANSFHRSNGSIYNRSAMHISLGYDKYHNYADMEIEPENLDLDSYIAINGYEKIVSDDKFMSFVITYSPHSPYTYSKIECQTNLSEIQDIYPEETDEEILCAYSAARETDNMFKILLEKLKKDNLLEDTIIVAFSDHPNYLKYSDNETNVINETLFFIYDCGMSGNQVSTITSSINILPTLVNLFGIETEYIYAGYDALNIDSGYVIFRDYTYYDGININSLTNEMFGQIDYSANVLISDYYDN